jgi:hypothetical protein
LPPGAEVDTNFRQMHGAPPGCERHVSLWRGS